MSGLLARDEKFKPLFEHKFKTPLMFINGAKEPPSPGFDDMIERADNPTVLKHPFGHSVPQDPKTVNAMIDFIKKYN
jgi:hypothetical protein